MKTGVAYLLLIVSNLLCIGGLHRFYLGKTGSGLLYLFTLNLLGIGSIIDLFLIPSMVDEANGYHYGHAPQVQQVVNVVVHTSDSKPGKRRKADENPFDFS